MKPILSLMAALSVAAFNLPARSDAAAITWKQSLDYGRVTNEANYLDSSGSQPPSFGSNEDVVFHSPGAYGAYILAGGVSTLQVNSLTVRSGIFTLEQRFDRSMTVGSGPQLLLKDAGVTVDAGSTAVIRAIVSRFNTSDPDNAIRFYVHDEGALILENTVNLTSKPLHKYGEGRLVFSANSGDVRDTAWFNFAEGVVSVSEGVVLGFSAGYPVAPDVLLRFDLGSATTLARLEGGGELRGTVTTHGEARSVLDLRAGALTIDSLDAEAGASFLFDLEMLHLLSGDGRLEIGRGNFDFTGGGAGVVYDLFEYDDVDFDPALFTVSGPYELDLGYGSGGWLLDDGRLSVRFAAIPEPGGVGLMLGGLMIYGCYARRRR